MKQLLSEVIKDIKPSKEYEKEILGKANSIINKINKGIKGAKAVLGGSGAKKTFLKTFDVDIFIKFNYNKFKDKSDKLSGILEKFLKKSFKITRLHGSRDYFQIKQGKFTFEIVPILSIKKAEQAKNITDVSPLHSNFVLKHKKLMEDMRLTKQFFKAAGVYGAESYIRGFSGYVCELLTIYYGSFLKLIKAISKWKEKTVIDIKGYYKNKNVFLEINRSKLTSPLIIIDPVQKDRNAAAALGYEKFDILIKKAREFQKNPSKKFFEIKVLTEKDIKKGSKNLIILKITPLKRKKDVAGAKMLKAFNNIENGLIDAGFKVVKSDMLWDKKSEALFYYVLKDIKLPKIIELPGPPLKIRQHVLLFKKAHKKTFVKNKRIFAVEKRKFTNANELIKNIIKTANVKDNIKNIKLI